MAFAFNQKNISFNPMAFAFNQKSISFNPMAFAFNQKAISFNPMAFAFNAKTTVCKHPGVFSPCFYRPGAADEPAESICLPCFPPARFVAPETFLHCGGMSPAAVVSGSRNIPAVAHPTRTLLHQSNNRFVCQQQLFYLFFGHSQV